MNHKFECVVSYLTRMAAPDAFLQNCYYLGLCFLGLIFTAMANQGVPLVSAAMW